MKHLRYFYKTCNLLSKNPLSLYRNSLRTCSTNSNDTPKKLPLEGPNLNDFIQGLSQQYTQKSVKKSDRIPYLKSTHKYGNNRKVYFDIYGCQMNVNDTEVIWSILKKNNFIKTNEMEDADVILVVTCAIRDGAEKKIWNKLQYLKGLKNVRAKNKSRYELKIGVLGCMAERLKHQLIEKEKAVDIVAGPDSYRDLPRLLALTDNNQTAVNVLLSMDETYADIVPVRLNENSISAFVSIMRGCDNMCTYCIVPFTRGRERSRPTTSIVEEVKLLSQQGVKEVTLLGQNVNSYRDLSDSTNKLIETNLAKGFKTVYKTKKGGRRFADLLDQISSIDPEMRIRFTSPHPKDFPDEVLHLIRERPNICNNLHLPAQSGSSAVLERMRRGYTREAYLELVEHVRSIIPNVALSSDFICGFCGETDEEFNETLSLIETVKYNMAFLFPYSMREKTTAYRRYEDDVPHNVKMKRLDQMINLYRNEVAKINQSQIGQHQLILIEGQSRRSTSHLAGRNDANIKVIIPNEEIPIQSSGNSNLLKNITVGDYVVVQINSANSQVLKGIPLYHTTLTEYHRLLPNSSHNLEYCEFKL
ncbi:CDK5RAP1-like protein [Chrysoperla carnea]|uniref:CDK5RAP1-like protein n=1 Tax=Chrysoperla carnea TaxID=189513 RepID=UPI001D063A93|nr:CDK5RAP1-like protein [Chrysoperla carnea]